MLQCINCGDRLDAGHDLSCHKCVKQIANDRDDLYDEVQKLKAKLSELTHGIPIEKAKADQGFFLLRIRGITVGNKTHVLDHFRVMNFNELGWFDPYATGGEVEDVQIIKAFPLPSQTQEGS